MVVCGFGKALAWWTLATKGDVTYKNKSYVTAYKAGCGAALAVFCHLG